MKMLCEQMVVNFCVNKTRLRDTKKAEKGSF